MRLSLYDLILICLTFLMHLCTRYLALWSDVLHQFPDSIAEFLVCLVSLNMATRNYAGQGQWDKLQLLLKSNLCLSVGFLVKCCLSVVCLDELWGMLKIHHLELVYYWITFGLNMLMALKIGSEKFLLSRDPKLAKDTITIRHLEFVYYWITFL